MILQWFKCRKYTKSKYYVNIRYSYELATRKGRLMGGLFTDQLEDEASRACAEGKTTYSKYRPWSGMIQPARQQSRMTWAPHPAYADRKSYEV